jgi:hypothetical protein
MYSNQHWKVDVTPAKAGIQIAKGSDAGVRRQNDLTAPSTMDSDYAPAVHD